jgi:hypothetical protein
MMKKEARKEGREAYQKGLAQSANPYKSDTFRKAWDLGWNDGRFLSRQARKKMKKGAG